MVTVEHIQEVTRRISSPDYYPGLWRSEIVDSEEFVSTIRSSLVLQQEGLANDLVYAVNRHRKEQGYDIRDTISLELGVSEEVWWAVHFNYVNFMQSVKAVTLTCNSTPIKVMEASWDKVFVGDKATGTSPVYILSKI